MASHLCPKCALVNVTPPTETRLRCPRCGKEYWGGKAPRTLDEWFRLRDLRRFGILSLVLLISALSLSAGQWGLEYFFGRKVGPDFLRLRVLRVTSLGSLCAIGLLIVYVIALSIYHKGYDAESRRLALGRIENPLTRVIVALLFLPSVILTFGIPGTLLLAIGVPLAAAAAISFAAPAVAWFWGAQKLLRWLSGWSLGFSFVWLDGTIILAAVASGLLAGLYPVIFRGEDGLDPPHVAAMAFLGCVLGAFAVRCGWVHMSAGFHADSIVAGILGRPLPEAWWVELVCGFLTGGVVLASIFLPESVFMAPSLIRYDGLKRFSRPVRSLIYVLASTCCLSLTLWLLFGVM